MRERIERGRAPVGDGRVRRDPHAEREGERRRAAADAPAPQRLRRDPRSEHQNRQARTAASAAPTDAPHSVVRIENPTGWILALPDLEGGRLSAHDHDVLGAARVLADRSGAAVVALAFGAEGGISPVDFGAAGADRLITSAHPDFARYAPERRALQVCAAIGALQPRRVLFPDSLIGGDIGRRVAADLGERAAAGVRRLEGDRLIVPIDGGAREGRRPIPRILLIAAEAADPVSEKRHAAEPLAAPPAELVPRIADGGLLPLDGRTVGLAEADFIVAAGNGVTDWPAFHSLAAALGAAEGGSRAVCDQGHLPRDRQVGTSGTLVRPRCYLALGIAGAPQHLAGIVACERVVAVNTDLHADMIKRADLAIVADAQAIMPRLSALLGGSGP